MFFPSPSYERAARSLAKTGLCFSPFGLFWALLGSLGALLQLSWTLLGFFCIFVCSSDDIFENVVDLGIILDALGP